jgi:membrane protein implicated in regulation of membrane protease activity
MRIIHIGLGRLGIKAKLILGLILVLGAALITLLALLALSMVLVGLPILVAAGIVYALLPKRRMPPAEQRQSGPDVLEGRFRVVDQASADTDRHLPRD